MPKGARLSLAARDAWTLCSPQPGQGAPGGLGWDPAGPHQHKAGANPKRWQSIGKATDQWPTLGTRTRHFDIHRGVSYRSAHPDFLLQLPGVPAAFGMLGAWWLEPTCYCLLGLRSLLVPWGCPAGPEPPPATKLLPMPGAVQKWEIGLALFLLPSFNSECRLLKAIWAGPGNIVLL